MARTDNDTWEITESVGATALGVAAARAAETEGENPLISDPFARVFLNAAGDGTRQLVCGSRPAGRDRRGRTRPQAADAGNGRLHGRSDVVFRPVRARLRHRTQAMGHHLVRRRWMDRCGLHGVDGEVPIERRSADTQKSRHGLGSMTVRSHPLGCRNMGGIDDLLRADRTLFRSLGKSDASTPFVPWPARARTPRVNPAHRSSSVPQRSTSRCHLLSTPGSRPGRLTP